MFDYNQCHGTDQYWNPNNLASTTTVDRLVLEENRYCTAHLLIYFNK